MGLVGPIIGLALFVSVLAVVGLGVLLVIRRAAQDKPAVTSSRTGAEPLDIARRRLAAGEITTEEFEEIRDRLQ
jgi:uncharacterized membrane protein